MPVIATFVFEKTTKNKVRFVNHDFGTIYVPNAAYEQLGQPAEIRMELHPERPALAQAA